MATYGSVNRVLLVGTLGKYGYELRATSNGTSVANCMIQTSELGQNGQEYVTLTPCEVWGKLAEAQTGLAPGDVVMVEGALKRKKGRTEGQWETVVNVSRMGRLSGSGSAPGAVGGEEDDIPF
mgnify:CR=1 FL=1